MNKAPWILSVVLLGCGLLLVAWSLPSSAASVSSELTSLRYVAPGGNCGIKAPCYAVLQAAVDAAVPGDEIFVAAGRYTGVTSRSGSTQHLYLNKTVTIRGGYHPLTWMRDLDANKTILDADGQGRVLVITGDINPLIDGLHLVGGAGGNGGGVYVNGAAVTLRNNAIYGNRAEGFGGGVYLDNSGAVLDANHIYTNTTGVTGRGGGVALSDSPALLDGNLIEDNSAFVGGGLMLSNVLGEGGALLTGNTIRGNVAFDLEQDGHTFDGAGGGIDLSSVLTDTLHDNVISGNIAKWGGGVHAFGSIAVMTGNRIQGNVAHIHGGGLYVQGGQHRIESNTILSNTAESWGGGLTLLADRALARDNLFQGNHSDWRGGGMYASGSSQFDANRFVGNSATEQGGGAFLYRQSGTVHRNNVFIENQAAEGGGLYLWASNVHLYHSTIADNSSGDGRAVVIDKYPGLVDPGATTLYTATVVFSNTILAGQPVGIFATPDNQLTVDAVLWHAMPTHIQAGGAALIVRNELAGDPVFQPDGYHLRATSAARDRAASDVDNDVDGHLRDGGNLADLGADEFVPTVVIDPETGGSVTYIDSQGEMTITLDVPPDAVDVAWGLLFGPRPPPPPIPNNPFGNFVGIGPPFRLEPYLLADPNPPDPFDPPLAEPNSEPLLFDRYPAHLVAEVGLEKLAEMDARMDQLELQLLAILDGPVLPSSPACGDITWDAVLGTMNIPLCDTGILTESVQTVAGAPDSALTSGSKSGYFQFVVRLKETTVYLPLVGQ